MGISREHNYIHAIIFTPNIEKSSFLKNNANTLIAENKIYNHFTHVVIVYIRIEMTTY